MGVPADGFRFGRPLIDFGRPKVRRQVQEEEDRQVEDQVEPQDDDAQEEDDSGEGVL